MFRNFGLFPMFINIKHPVPYVFLAAPGSKQACPNNAACWSPATPLIGMETPNISLDVSPITLDEGTTSGKIHSGISICLRVLYPIEAH